MDCSLWNRIRVSNSQQTLHNLGEFLFELITINAMVEKKANWKVELPGYKKS